MLQGHGLDELNNSIDDCGPLLTALPRNQRRRITFVAEKADVDLTDIGALDDLHELARTDGADFDELGRKENDVVPTV